MNVECSITLCPLHLNTYWHTIIYTYTPLSYTSLHVFVWSQSSLPWYTSAIKLYYYLRLIHYTYRTNNTYTSLSYTLHLYHTLVTHLYIWYTLIHLFFWSVYTHTQRSFTTPTPLITHSSSLHLNSQSYTSCSSPVHLIHLDPPIKLTCTITWHSVLTPTQQTTLIITYTYSPYPYTLYT